MGTERTVDTNWWTRVLAGPDGSIEAEQATERYVVLPRPSDPRVVVDRTSTEAVRDAVERFASSRTTNTVVGRLVRTGAPMVARLSPSWAVASASGPTLRSHLSELLGEPVCLSIAVGPPRPNRKPVVRCYGQEGLIAVAKLGPDAHTAAMVRNEATWLAALEREPFEGVQTPTLLHAGEFGDSALLVMGAMPLESDLGVAFDDVPLTVVKELSARHLTDVSLLDTAWWNGVHERLGRPELDEIATHAHQLANDEHIEGLVVSGWHGDWSPWNMGRSTSGDLFVWDWERATAGVPLGFDLLHLHYQYGAGLDAADASLLTLGVDAQQLDLIKALYLVEVCARHADAGTLSSERHQAATADLGRLRRRAQSS